MDGIICVDKPNGFTSFDLIAKCRGIFSERRMGHGGTLDPLATGVMVLYLGKATTAADLAFDKTKEYIAGVKLGIETDTYDTTGRVIKTAPTENITAAAFETAIKEYIGETDQTPPPYSAVSVGGRRLYDIARSGGIENVVIPSRKITVYSAAMLLNPPYTGAEGDLFFCIRCSAGTYVRSIIHAIGQTLGCGAAMSSLRRTAAGVFTLKDCHSLDRLQQTRDETGLPGLEDLLSPVSRAFDGYPAVDLPPDRVRYFLNGAESRLPGLDITGICTVWNGQTFLGIGSFADGVLYTKKVYCTQQL